MTRGAYLALHLVPAAFLIGAIGPWPYGYFTLLRLVVCIATLWLAYLDYQSEDKVGPWLLAMSVAAILFNPIIPVHLTRDIWFFLDLGMAALFGVHFATTRQQFEP